MPRCRRTNHAKMSHVSVFPRGYWIGVANLILAIKSLPSDCLDRKLIRLLNLILQIQVLNFQSSKNYIYKNLLYLYLSILDYKN